MKEICDQWKREMREMRRERQILIGVLIALIGVKPYVM